MVTVNGGARNSSVIYLTPSDTKRNDVDSESNVVSVSKAEWDSAKVKVRVKLGPVGVTSSQGSSEPASSTDEEEEGHIDTSEDDNTSRKDSSSLSDDEDAFHASKRPLRAASTLTTSSKAEERLAISELDRAIDDNDDDSDYDADCSQAADTCSSALTPRRVSSPSSCRMWVLTKMDLLCLCAKF